MGLNITVDWVCVFRLHFFRELIFLGGISLGSEAGQTHPTGSRTQPALAATWVLHHASILRTLLQRASCTHLSVLRPTGYGCWCTWISGFIGIYALYHSLLGPRPKGRNSLPLVNHPPLSALSRPVDAPHCHSMPSPMSGFFSLPNASCSL